MTKSDLIDVLCETQKIPKGRAELLVQVIFESMEVALKRGERIEIRGFGSFELRSYRPYEGRNPRTGVRVSVQPKRLPFFKVGKELKERVNAGKQAKREAPARLRDAAPIGRCRCRSRSAGPDHRPAHRQRGDRSRRCRACPHRHPDPRHGLTPLRRSAFAGDEPAP